MAIEIHGEGNGPLAALVHGFGTIGVPRFEIAGYKEHALESGEEAADMYQTHGIPVELLEEFAQEEGLGLDLEGFDLIVPCGLEEIEMTSVATELVVEGRDPEPAAPGRGALDQRVRAVVADSISRALAG